MNNLVLITGASRGIGKATAEVFAKNGWDLALVCRKNTDLLKVHADHLTEKYGANVYCYAGDVADYRFIESIRSDLEERNVQPEILINNAGISVVGLMTDLTPGDWAEVMNTNLTSVFNTCNLFVPGMVRRKSGRIINVSSIWGNVGASCEVAYSASKGGVNSFTRALAKELAPSGISVNAVAFGAIDTEMNGHLSAEEKAAFEEEIPAGRMGTPEEAAAFTYQIATAPGYMTGQIVTFDGAYL
uniref:elongation factor P 5-aminopentanone reductase n=1 Tax=Eubacterium cellulosolvens TaxID=29322 RepID=UPI0004804089|nr:SDR family NAD(P)-dependent oxidoreductase [[Eubacterium] cellulosolvens]